MTQTDFETFINDPGKRVTGDIEWSGDADHSPAVEFQVELESDAGYPVVVKGRHSAPEPGINITTFAIIHRSSGRIYALDLGKDHRNPDGGLVGSTHKHRWNEAFRDKEAYVPSDITAGADQPLAVWGQFCAEAKIEHRGIMHPPPPVQTELL